jgi:hypothetical protein
MVLKDNNLSTTYTGYGIQEGDYLVIDPAGQINSGLYVEFGYRPQGDVSVVTRAEYVPGFVSQFDDNRGFYKITEVGSDYLEVSGESGFAGDTTSGDVILASGTRSYVIYPTVGLPNTEGQNDLRVTAYKGATIPNSFSGNLFSIAPFSYKVIRPYSMLSESTIELVLMLRERMLSWVEVIQNELRQGSYYIFQKDLQCSNLTLGYTTNTNLVRLQGIAATPFANNSDCLSILDRRFWLGDMQLDYEPAGGPTYYSDFGSGLARPILLDYIELALGGGDKLRQRRYDWIDFRTNLVTGTLPMVERLEAQVEKDQGDRVKRSRLRGI